MNNSKFTQAADHDYLFEEKQPSTGYSDYEATIQVSMETHIPENNIGYKLLQKMGWQAGRGLGSQGQGRIDPIRIELKDDSLGVGKAEEYTTTHVSTTAKRKALDSEKQLEETEIQKIERQYQVEKKQAIAQELKEVKKAFYCELCDKQYKNISEYEQHLQSYDHHHKKRFKDMKENTRNSTINQSEREKKLARERKREERELKRIQDAIQKKLGSSGSSSNNNNINTNLSPTATALPAIPMAGTASISGGGWTNADTKPNFSSGGWSTSTIPIAKPTVPVAKPIDNAKPTPSDTTADAPISTPSTSQPKKLSFGLKKSTGFQFGLKKK
ncbi:G patch domain-containing protein 8-like [Mucor ambiguus]|uniref:G patch domain-containing protein 8-like n=1 Tax=Mucor ambiguus TaxID=91626 RepID=A0A0C9MWC2_9FUNG|nr:G patch domain-containing protein 8-like [Mucor ambiguus]